MAALTRRETDPTMALDKQHPIQGPPRQRHTLTLAQSRSIVREANPVPLRSPPSPPLPTARSIGLSVTRSSARSAWPMPALHLPRTNAIG